MDYTPRAIPPYLEELRDISSAMGVTKSLLVGSALRDADNGIPVTSYSLYMLPTREIPTHQAVEIFLKENGQGSRIMRSFNNQPRHEIRMASGHIANLNFCHQAWMLEAETIARRIPNGLSAIAMDLFTGEINATQLYRLDKSEGVITQVVPMADPGNLVALSVQKRYPTYAIMADGNKQMLHPPIKSNALA